VLGERQRQNRPPAFGEHPDRAGPEPVADRLQRNGVGTGGESVGQLGERDAGLGRLAFGPLVPVKPDLHRIREIGAHLDKSRPEIVVPDVKVVAGHPPIGLGEAEPHRVAALFLGGGEHRRELLRDPDRGHPGPARRRLPRQIWAHHVDLAVVLGEPHHRDPIVGGETLHRPPERGADLLQDRRRRDRITQMRGQKRDHLPTHLQVRHIAVEINPIQTLNIEPHMPIEHIVDRYYRSHDS